METRIYSSIHEIPTLSWDALVPADFPFAEHRFFSILESSGAIGTKSGWDPRYLTLWRDGKLVGASFLFLKSHSYGEYIFDWEWARAYAEHGLKYYPKLLSAVPFTPATGAKLLTLPGTDQRSLRGRLLTDARDLMHQLGASSLHWLFCTAEEIEDFEQSGFLSRHTFQFHWYNKGYRSFDEFLAALKSRKRKQIVNERKGVADQGIEIRVLTGEDLTLDHARQMYQFYRSTIDKMGAIPYLPLSFFESVILQMGREVVLIFGYREGVAIAGSIFFLKGGCLYGRYWGATQELDFLHFEICYYRAIELCIDQKIHRFEAGAQGGHKVARGFLPVTTYSAHWIENPEFRAAIAQALAREKAGLQEALIEFEPAHPYHA